MRTESAPFYLAKITPGLYPIALASRKLFLSFQLNIHAMKTLSLCLIWLFAISLSFSVKANQAPDIPPPFQQQTTLSEKQFQRLERRMERAEKRIERRLQKQQDKPKNLLGRARAALVLSILGILPLIGIVFTLIAIPLLLSTNRAINKRPTENKEKDKTSPVNRHDLSRAQRNGECHLDQASEWI
jgi:hypothetical protein